MSSAQSGGKHADFSLLPPPGPCTVPHQPSTAGGGRQGRPGDAVLSSPGGAFSGPERAEKGREWVWEQGKWRRGSTPSKPKTLAVSPVEPAAG